MNRSLIVGVLLAAAILVVWLFIPPLFPTETQQSDAALRDATQAVRTLYYHDPRLSQLEELTDLPKLKEQDFQHLADSSEETFRKLNEEFQEQARLAQERDRRAGLPAGQYPAPQGTGAGVQSAVGGLGSLLAENQKLLTEAAKLAQAAAAAGSGTVGAAQAQGMVEYVRASNLLLAAQKERGELDTLYDRLLDQATGWKLAHAAVEHYGKLDTTEIVEGLRKDLGEVSEMQTAAAAAADELEKSVADREQALLSVRMEMEKSRNRLLQLEAQGFRAGDDAAFEAYRLAYGDVTAKLNAQQQTEQELADGGLKGVELDDETVMTGELTGGDAVTGLAELKRQLERAKDKADRLAKSKTAFEERIAAMEKSGRDSGALKGRFASEQTKDRTQLDETVKAIDQLAEMSWTKEDEALQAANKALQAFRTAESDADKLIRQAGDTQRDADPNRQNERLKMILDDAYLAQIGASAGAETRMLIGRLHAQRADSLARHIKAFERYAELTGAGAFDKKELQAKVDTARDSAIQTLNDAVQVYDKLARGPTGVTAWVPQSSLAACYFLLSTIDLRQADMYRGKAVEAIQKAVEKREQAPYLAQQVRFRNHLTGGAPPPAPSTQPGDTPADATTKPGDTEKPAGGT